jgi:vancomycin resistance protein VanJ
MAAMSVFAIAMVAWNILRLYPGDRWLPVRLGNFVAPWLFLVLLVALAVAWLGRRPWLSRLLTLLVLVSALRFWPVLTPRLSGPNAQANAPVSQLRVMTFNVHFSNRDALGIADLVRAETPDIVAFQECTMDLITPLHAGLGGEYPYFLLDDGETPRLVLMSRYPLQGYVPPPGAWRTQWAQVETPLGLVTVWNVHSSSSLSQRAWEWQREVFSAVANQVDGEEGPVLVLGDFNTTDHNDNYRLMADRLTDVHRAVGWGFGFTFPRRWLDGQDLSMATPALRIDHIFISDHWEPLETHVVTDGFGSDHLPVVATLRWRY